nr:putative reverse transcriptase domain-containing protein [Tanacetum cinerariifolium]
MAVRDFKKFFKRRGRFVRQPWNDKKTFQRSRDDKNGKNDRKCFRCGDLNHLIGECPKPPKDKDQKSFVEGSWSDSGEEDDEKICLGVNLEPDEWIKDNECSKHMTDNQKLFTSYKAYNGDEPLAIPLDEIKIDDKFNFIEEPVEIMDREVKRLKQSCIPIVKVCWNSRRGPEFTWEREDQMRKKYPHLFVHLSSTS